MQKMLYASPSVDVVQDSSARKKKHLNQGLFANHWKIWLLYTIIYETAFSDLNKWCLKFIKATDRDPKNWKKNYLLGMARALE